MSAAVASIDITLLLCLHYQLHNLDLFQHSGLLCLLLCFLIMFVTVTQLQFAFKTAPITPLHEFLYPSEGNKLNYVINNLLSLLN
ncbi:uncharacterized protein DS421_13g401630 [Arachis hypogaea]|nr:uncharacterized protein DS421_13g401630 [Arachis hypogaea]